MPAMRLFNFMFVTAVCVLRFMFIKKSGVNLRMKTVLRLTVGPFGTLLKYR